MNVDDSYQELGLRADSTDAEVKAAWRRLAARWHPDRNDSPHALRKIQRINRAWKEIREARDSAPGALVEEPEEDESSPGSPMEHTVGITLEEVVTGCTRELQGELVQDCADCAGSGLQREVTRCGECDGSGRVRQHLWFSWVAPSVPCSACQGQGVARQGCACCAATGKLPPRKYRCRVQVPRGARAGDVLEVKARVALGKRFHELALRVRVELEPHAFFTFESDGTLKCELPVDGFAWMANRWIDVPTPRGLQQMRLQRGHLNYRIKGAGLPWLAAGAAADGFVTVTPLFPEEFSPQQDAAVDRLIASNTGAAATAAGERTAAWKRVLKNWLRGLG